MPALRHTVTIKVTTTNDDGYGNFDPTDSDRTVTGLLFAPEGLAGTNRQRAGVETLDGTEPVVLGDATLYGDTGVCDHNDTLTHENTCCDGSLFAHGVWAVVGGSKGWGGGKFVLPIRQPRST